MKQLQNNYTTPEQSMRLLELGLPADSADMFYFAIGNSKENYDGGIFYETPDVLKCGNIFHELTKNTIPCWSVGRLIEISIICGIGDRVPNELYINKYSLDPSLVENIIHRLERVADLSVNDIDFSILED